ncbi:MAG: beta-galactosidase trimerization domain-containing protein [Myxococcales bacterium]|nr:beta-galactosidase trimerization domain-containing protein [Myxococcales bacterium]
MDFIKRPALEIAGKRSFLLGVNYWSRAGGPRMWQRERFDADAVRAELEQMRRVGLNCCRSFAFLPSLMPEPGRVDDACAARMARFYELCGEVGVATIPTFLVGHMSGENYDFVGQNGRSPYTDGELRDWQDEIVRAVVGAAGGHDAVIAYLATNEMPLWGLPSTPEIIGPWAARLCTTLRDSGGAQPFGVGDGVMNLKGGQNGFDVETLRETVDFFGPHTYYADADVLRQAYNAEYCLRSLTYSGKPVIFEEFGGSSSQVSEQNRVLYYREVLAACLGSGACGALGWCFSDFDLEDEPPYNHHAFELGFGITRADGADKPVCGELSAFSQLLAQQIDFAALETPRARAAIVVPSYFNTTYPFSAEDRVRMRRVLLQSYALAASAGIETELVPESQPFDDYALLLCPSTQKLRSPTWRRLLEAAERGATVYWSYYGGDYNFHQGAWCHLLEELCGCRHELRYGLPDLPAEQLTVRGAGLYLSINTTYSNEFARAFLPVRALDATVLATDHLGHAALLRAERGRGQVLLSTFPFEHYLATQRGSEQSSVHGLYALLAERAGLEHPIGCDQPAVQRRLLRAGDHTLLSLFNHSWRPLAATVNAPAGEPIYGGGEPLRGAGPQQLAVEPKEWLLYRLA